MRTGQCPDKQAALSFMRSFEPVAAAAGYVYNEVAGSYADGITELAHQHEDWEWYQRDIYHFEKYDLELDPGFIDFALRSRRGLETK